MRIGRMLTRSSVFNMISIIGLAFTLCFVLLIYLFIYQELSFDRNYKNAKRTYVLNNTIPVGPHKGAVTGLLPPALANAIKEEVSEISTVTRYKYTRARFKLNGLDNNELVAYVDPDFLTIFYFDFLHGDPETALISKNSIVINEAMAEKYFGRINPMGGVIQQARRSLL